MPYACAFIEEVFRFRTLTPLGGVQHLTSEIAKLGDYFIPKGVMVGEAYRVAKVKQMIDAGLESYF